MDLTSDAIGKIETLCESAQTRWEFKDVPGFIRKQNSKNGDVLFQPAQDLPLKASVLSVDDFANAAERYSSIEMTATIWVNERSCTLVTDESRLASVVLPLRVNPVIEVLKSLKGLSVKAMNRKLKVDLFSATLDPEDFAESVSALTFEVNETNSAVIKKGDESIGKNVRAKVTGEKDIPDTVSFAFRVYPDLSLDSEVVVMCAVITEPAEGTISVIPYPGQIERAMIEAINSVAVAVRGKPGIAKTPVFCGTCS